MEWGPGGREGETWRGKQPTHSIKDKSLASAIDLIDDSTNVIYTAGLKRTTSWKGFLTTETILLSQLTLI